MHIDGHSDEALPQLFDGVPFFEWPSTDEQVRALMQKNDVFIMVSDLYALVEAQALHRATMRVFLISKPKCPWHSMTSNYVSNMPPVYQYLCQTIR